MMPMNRNVLIVDDNPKNLQIIAALLSENHYKVEVALNGVSAIKWMQQKTFDAVLLDVMMPEMNGFQTCKKIKADSRNSHIPIIFLTALHDIQSITMGFETGGVDYITKPFNQAELLARLNTHIELKQSREKLEDLNGWLKQEVDKKTEALKRANTKLCKANNELKLMDVAKNDFLNSISHELRTPLNGIVGSINLLNAYEHDNHVKEVLELLEASVNNLEKYSYAALQISNLQLKGESHLNLHEVDVVSVLRAMETSLKAKVHAKCLTFKLISNCHEAIVNVDIQYLQNAIVALIDCSLVFTHQGNITLRLSISDSQMFQLIIDDDGSYYTGDQLKHFFNSVNNQNYQFERNNAMELYLAKMIILLHKGTIHFTNKEGISGTQTIIHLPLIAKTSHV
jgi:two-component system sensor histidine kinase/response regulator